MDRAELERKLAAIPEESPDSIDLEMIAAAQKENDDTAVTLEQAKAWLEYSGKLNIRIPKSLHYRLAELAKEDGVSLNQYILYKLAQ